MVRLTLFIYLFIILSSLFSVADGGGEMEAYFPPTKLTVEITVEDRNKLEAICNANHSEYVCSLYFEDILTSYHISTNGFFMDKYPVTYADFKDHCRQASCGKFWDRFFRTNRKSINYDQPVTGVTWDEADKYCQDHGKRLPFRDEYEVVMYKNEVFPWSYYDFLIEPLKEGHKVKRKYRPVGSNQHDVGNNGVYDIFSNCPEWTGTDVCHGRHRSYHKVSGVAFLFAKECNEKTAFITKGVDITGSASGLFVFKETVQINDSFLRETIPIGFRCARDAD